MPRNLFLFWTLVVLALLIGCAPHHAAPVAEGHGQPYHWPSDAGVPDNDPVRAMPGWMGRTLIEAPGCWSDTDGVTPEVPGYHIQCKSKDGCQTCGKPTGLVVPEGCHAFERTVDGHTEVSPRWLIETNPDAEVCHPHTGGEGHPDVFDCEAYCKGTPDPQDGLHYTAGGCVAVPIVRLGLERQQQASARCYCMK